MPACLQRGGRATPIAEVEGAEEQHARRSPSLGPWPGRASPYNARQVTTPDQLKRVVVRLVLRQLLSVGLAAVGQH